MKKTITVSIAAIFCFVISVNAQINKGSILLGGTINGSASNVKNPDNSVAKLNNFTVAPAIGFAVSTNTILGFSLSYSTSNSKYYNTPVKQKNSSYGAGVFLRKYKLLAKNFYLFGDGNLMYNHTTYNYSTYYQVNNGDYNSKANAVTLNVTPGISYNLTRSIQIESGLQNLLYVSYGTHKETPKNSANAPVYKGSNFSIGTSLNTVSLNNIFVGIRFLLNK